MTDTFTAQQLRFDRTLDAPIDTVWRYVIEPDLRARWFMGGPTEPRVGGKLGLTFDHGALSDDDIPTPERYAPHVGKAWAETIEAIDPPHRLAFSWDDGAAGHVTIELTPIDGGRTRLVLTHDGLRGAQDAVNFGGGWGSHLDALERRVAGHGVADFWALHVAAEDRARAALG